jgi:hypothetical protein
MAGIPHSCGRQERLLESVEEKGMTTTKTKDGFEVVDDDKIALAP